MKFNYGLEIDDICRHKDTPNYGYAHILEIGYFGKSYKIAKCHWSVSENSGLKLIKYFKLRDLIKIEDIQNGI